MSESIHQTRAGRFFWALTGRPRTIVVLSVLAIVAVGLFVPRLKRDASAEAFIPKDDPAVVYRQKVKDTFGLADPIVVVVSRDGAEGVFNPESLRLIDSLTESISQLPGVNPDRVTSLATENDIIGTDDGLLVQPFFAEPPATQAQADRVRQRVLAFDLYVGALVSRGGDVALIAAELLDEADGARVYEQVVALVEEVPKGDQRVQVAGEGAVSAHLGAYIDADMRRLNLLCGVVITIVLFLSYRTALGVFLPTFVVLGAVAAALGLMAACDVPFYVITNALPVILIAIGVADSVHILGEYYEQSALRPAASQRELVVSTMVNMWRPVTVTSLTDMAGFLGIYAASIMPPMKAFGIYAALGAGAALGLSLFVIPACMVLLRRRESTAFVRAGDASQAVTVDRFGLATAALGRLVGRHAVAIVIAAGAIVLLGVVGALKLEVNEQRINNFKASEPIYQADLTINRKLNGSNYLDVVVETNATEGLFQPANLQRIEALQDHLLSLPHVKGATSIVDYLKQMNRALHADDPSAYRLPDSEELVAQYLLLYSASGSLTELEHTVDYDYRLGNIRVVMDSGMYTDEKLVVESAQRYIEGTFNAAGITAHLAGRVNVDYHWIDRLARNHFRSVFPAFVAVWLTLAISFRSAIAGLFALAPVSAAVLLIYAVMGFGGIWLSVGTSMFAAIAIGTGVDFAVHTLDRLIVLVQKEGRDLDDALAVLFASTGRALLFNFSAVLLGFGLLMTSHVPPLIRFGVLITVCIATSFLASMTVLPALLKLIRPAFLTGKPASGRRRAAGVALLVAVTLLLGAAATTAADAEPPDAPDAPESPDAPPTGDQIAQRVNQRDDGARASRTLVMEMIDASGKKRTRLTRTFRKQYDSEKRIAIFYLEPQNVKGTGFLNIDYAEPDRDDDRWLYLPALRKVRRISASRRGDYFLGTDFTYEDINNQTKVNVADYTRKYLRTEELDGRPCLVMEAVPLNERIAKEFRCSRIVSWVDPELWMLRKTEYWDLRGKRLKTIQFRKIEKVQKIWTTHQLVAENHQTGHKTNLTFKNVDYETPIPDELFTVSALRRGL